MTISQAKLPRSRKPAGGRIRKPGLASSYFAQTEVTAVHPIIADDGWIAIVILLLVLILLAVTGHLKL